MHIKVLENEEEKKHTETSKNQKHLLDKRLATSTEKVKVLPILINGGQHTRLAVVHLVQARSINHITCQNRRAVSGNPWCDSARGGFHPYYNHYKSHLPNTVRTIVLNISLPVKYIIISIVFILSIIHFESYNCPNLVGNSISVQE